MTVVEFFDKSPVFNIVSALLCKPERVIYVGKDKKNIERAIERYQRVLRGRGIEIEMLHQPASKNSLDNVVQALESVLAAHDDCVFDLTGGSDLELVAIGIVTERYKGRVKSHRFNINTSTLVDCDLDGNVCSTTPFDLTVEENIIIHGGEALHAGESNVLSLDLDFDENLVELVDRAWDLCCENSELWNDVTSVLAALNRIMDDPLSLNVSVSPSEVAAHLQRVKIKQATFIGFMRRLSELKLIRSFFYGAHVQFTYSSLSAKRCLSVSGQILELRIASRIEALRGDDGEQLYHSTRMGVMVDWNPDDVESEIRVVNEIDVVTMKDAIPIFISCKNGNFTQDEFYKLSTVAERFGAGNAKKVLIATGIEGGIKGEHLRARAEAMGVRLIDNAHTATDAELDRILRSLWSN